MKKPSRVAGRKPNAVASGPRHPSPAICHVTDVSAALIFHHGKLLVTRRHARSHLGGLWEFPGGKREPGETFKQCLVREIQEELGVTIAVGRLFESITHAYPEKTVQLKFFVCRLLNGEPQTLGCAAFKWVTRPELADYDFPAADVKLLQSLQNSPELWAQI